MTKGGVYTVYDKEVIYFAPTKDLATVPIKKEDKLGFHLFPMFKEKELRIEPMERTTIKLGFRSFFDKKWGFILKEERELAQAGGFILGGIINSDYVDEWEIVLYNTNKDKALIIDKRVDKIIVENDSIRYPYLMSLCCAILQGSSLVKYEITFQEELFCFRDMLEQ